MERADFPTPGRPPKAISIAAGGSWVHKLSRKSSSVLDRHPTDVTVGQTLQLTADSFRRARVTCSSWLFLGVANPAAGPPTRGNSATETGSVGMFTCLQGLFAFFPLDLDISRRGLLGCPGAGLSGAWGDPHHVRQDGPAGRTARAGPHLRAYAPGRKRGKAPRTSLSPNKAFQNGERSYRLGSKRARHLCAPQARWPVSGAR